MRDTIAEADDDGNEEIEFEEFCRLLLRKKHEVHQQGELREAFNVSLQCSALLLLLLLLPAAAPSVSITRFL